MCEEEILQDGKGKREKDSVPFLGFTLSCICISQNLVLLTYYLFCLNNKGGA